MVENKLQNPPIASQTVEEKPSSGQSLGKLMSEARSRRGASREQVAQETRIPPSYIRMIESDNYSEISDQLYLLPFLRRYAAHLGLDSEEIASRFVGEIQRTENTAVRMAEPIEMITPRKTDWARILPLAVAIAILITAALFAWQRFGARAESKSASELSPGAISSPIAAVPAPALPPSSDPAGSAAPATTAH